MILAAVNGDDIIGIIVAVAMAVYLVYALVNPEKM